ncbi:undecaprenyl-phosphate mannosyltransferase [Methanobrevibacter cuticularis]|uniref:Undecaprenyl-phosphate mannosyltransferase n=1 Tax=Methanobrevibacter cuticularis TaxID=47311 RepID=A0A166DU56_9EURY|nr:glycosyltransferase family 2 protein [Methanobrevibacter cuticularis]KZX15953.1 undecaprenyl-phosphate mannosyltransferase [Methanobrevibacter cuticularis]
MSKTNENPTIPTKILAIIPAYNEEVAIGDVISKTKKYVDRVVVVDDGSSDKTVEIAKLAGAEVIVHKNNMGKGEALKSGFEAVNDEDIVVTIDGDGQNNPDEIPKLIEPIINKKADLVNGSRYIEGYEFDTPFYRRVGQKVLDIATNVSTGLNITDSQNGFRAFSKIAIPCFKFRNSGFAIESEMLADASEAGLTIFEVPITVRYDLDGSTQNPVTHGVMVLWRVFQDMRFRRPILYFTLVIGILLVILLVIFFISLFL